jgi:Stage II sporulation protein E (SpoIIE)
MGKVGTMLLLGFLFVFLFVSSSLLAQPKSTPKPPAPSAETMTLGNSAATLPGPWKFIPGDSPWENGAPLWAQPGFDDAAWANVDLAPKAGSVDPAYGTPGFVPGWTARGYPNLHGYAWYRLRVHVTDPGQPLQLKMPNNVDDAYQIYANGHYVGQFGNFSPDHVTIYSARSFSFPLPPPGPDGEILMALRFYMTGGTRFQSPDAGGMHEPPALGLASAVHLLQTSDDDANQHFYFGTVLQSLLSFLVIPLALWAWLQNRQDRTYLWLFLVLSCALLRIVLLLTGNLMSALPLGPNTLLLDVVLAPLQLPLWAMFWWHWFGLQGKRWIPKAAWLITIAQMLAVLCLRLPNLDINLVPRSWLPWLNNSSVACLVALGVLLLVILVEGLRRDRTEALLAALPLLLIEFASFNVFFLNTFGISTVFFLVGLGISVGSIAWILMVLVIGALVMRRFLRTRMSQERARQIVALDMEQAQQLQQRVLVPEVLHSPAFSVQTEYWPAQTVGGDFFQTLSKPDGSLLVVLGDVSGKGMSAAMLVAVLVGAIRTRAEESFDPAAMLTMLNQRLIGRSGGHLATCLAAELQPDGSMRIANAGHLPPYLNGLELELEGSLPLGAANVIDSSSRILSLEPGDRLTFLTDGVVEAMNSANELFGFDRARTISNLPAATIARQAQSFGQNDDITVLSVEFAGAPSEATDEALAAV